MPMSVGYARVSTPDQDLALQLDALQAAGCARISTEKASDAQRDRPQLVCCTRLPARRRYARGLEARPPGPDRCASSSTPSRLCTARQIGLRSLTEAIDTGTPGGTLVFHLFGALAEFERSIIRERTRAGLAAARARGRPAAGLLPWLPPTSRPLARC